MIGFKLDPSRKIFMDLTAVRTPIDRASRQVHSRFGAFVRKKAKWSIRKRKKSSVAPAPPSSHTGFLKRLIVFNVENNGRNVVIGPLLMGRRVVDGSPIGGMTVPEVLEYGGSISVDEYQREYTPNGRSQVISMGIDPDRWHRIGKKRLWHKGGQPLRIRQRRRRTLSIAARPFMQPAFDAELPKLAGMWADSVKP